MTRYAATWPRPPSKRAATQINILHANGSRSAPSHQNAHGHARLSARSCRDPVGDGDRMSYVGVLGLTFAGSATPRRAEMAEFLRNRLGLSRVEIEGVEADVFRLPDQSLFAVSTPGGMGQTARSIGFLVDDLDAMVAGLVDAGVEVGLIGRNAESRYAHFRAPDGHLYELVERLAGISQGPLA